MSAAGKVTPGQIIVQGKTLKALPQVGVYEVAQWAARDGGKGKNSGVGAVLVQATECANGQDDFGADVPRHVHHFAGTYNHWADFITSIDFLEAIIAPFFKREMALLEARGVQLLPDQVLRCAANCRCAYCVVDAAFAPNALSCCCA